MQWSLAKPHPLNLPTPPPPTAHISAPGWGWVPVWSLSRCKRDPPFSALARASAIIFMITQLSHSDFPAYRWGEREGDRQLA